MKDGQPVLTEFGKKALNGETVNVPEEWGSGTWKDGVSQLNYIAVHKKDINPDTGFPYDYTLWDSVIAENQSALDKDWREHMGADTTMDFLQKNDKIIVAPGSAYAAPEEESTITTLRGQCKATIVDHSWKMIFAKDEAEFDSLLKDMQDTLEGLEYETVLDYDMSLAEEQNKARLASIEEFAGADNSSSAQEETSTSSAE